MLHNLVLGIWCLTFFLLQVMYPLSPEFLALICTVRLFYLFQGPENSFYTHDQLITHVWVYNMFIIQMICWITAGLGPNKRSLNSTIVPTVCLLLKYHTYRFPLQLTFPWHFCFPKPPQFSCLQNNPECAFPDSLIPLLPTSLQDAHFLDNMITSAACFHCRILLHQSDVHPSRPHVNNWPVVALPCPARVYNPICLNTL